MLSLRVRLLLVLTASLLVSADTKPPRGAGELLNVLVVQERGVLEALLARDAKALRQILADNYQGLGFPSPGRQSRSDLLNSLSDLRLVRVVPDDPRVVPLNQDAALLSYQLLLEGSFKGVAFPTTPVIVSSVWVRQGGRWRLAFHQTALLGRPAPQRGPLTEGFQAEMSANTFRCTYGGPGRLEDVQASLTVRLANDTSLPFPCYWGSWQPGEVKEVHLPLADVRPVERVDLVLQATREGKAFSRLVSIRR